MGLNLSSEFTDALFIPNDIIGGLILVLIGIIFFIGVKELISEINDGVAYIYFGIFLALIFVIIYLLIIVANAIEAYVIVSDDFSTWTPLDDLKPGLYLGLLPFIGLIVWKSRFTLNRTSKVKSKR